MPTASRQVRRHNEREAAKRSHANGLTQARIATRRAKLQRQSEREKSRFYEGTRSVAASVALSRSRINSRKVQKGKAFGRHIRKSEFYGKAFVLHATKGWRAA